jgi:hypothetical protein
VFLLWVRMLRILSVSKTMGPFVILTVSMGQDISKFAVVYAVFLIAFSVLIRGSMPFTFEDVSARLSPSSPCACMRADARVGTVQCEKRRRRAASKVLDYVRCPCCRTACDIAIAARTREKFVLTRWHCSGGGSFGRSFRLAVIPRFWRI